MVAALLLLYSAGVSAQLSFHDPGTNQGVLDQVVSQFATRASAWQGVVMSAATWLFWTLGTISFTWTMGMLALRKADIGDFFAEFIRFILFFGFFYWLLQNGPKFADSIIQSLRQIADKAAGTTGLSPSGIVDVGFMIWKQAIANLSVWSPIDSFVGTALSAGIMLMLAAVGVNMLLLLVSAWVLMYAGIFYLGFGGSRWTSDMAINYYKTVLGLAVQLFTMILLVGIGNDLLLSFYAKMNRGQLNFEELGVMLVFCFALLMLVGKVPGLLSGIITGASISHTGIGNYGVGSVVGAAMGAAAVAAGAAGVAGAAVMGGARNIAGGAQALMAAFSKANENVQSGSDVLGGVWGSGGRGDGGGGGGGGGGTSSGGDYSTGNTPFAQAAGFASSAGGSRSATDKGGKAAGGGSGKQATGGESKQGGSGSGRVGSAVRTVADAGANLARGVAEVAKTSMMERVADTTGGRIAASIKGTRDDIPTFEENLLSSEKQVDREAEIEAFVRKGT